MSLANDEIIKAIKYYQERLDRYASNKNEEKMLYVIKKLNKLPINTAHLENTGVGRTVNALKKHEGRVGEAAKELVASWKVMVLREEKASQDEERVEPEEDEEDSLYSSEHEAESCSGEESESDEAPKENLTNSSPEPNHSNKYNEEYVKHNNKKHKIPHEGETSSDNEHEEKEKHSKKRSHSNEDERRESKTKNCKYNSDVSRHEDGRKHRSKSSDVATKHESSSKTDNRKYDDSRTEKSEHKKRIKDAENQDQNSGSKHKSEKRKRDEDEELKSRHRSDKKESTSSKTDKHRDEPDKKKETSKNPEKKHKSHRSHQEKGSSSKKDHEKHGSGSKQKSHRSVDEKRDKKKHKELTPKNKDQIINGIDSESGASFADALGMCGPVPVIYNNTKKKSVSSGSSDKHKNLDADRSVGSSSAPKSRTSSSSCSKSEKTEEDIVPELLMDKNLEPLNINISSLLPEITPNYRPLGMSLDLQPKRAITDDEALSRVMSNRNQRTKVYSGNKSVGKVESLFQICVRVLQDNIDALEYTGGVPYIILKPILERATPDQLFNMEHHNPYLIEDTDELWLLHCQKEFRTKKRDELESWRDMYMRCLDEREARLNAITANIKQSQDKTLPVRTTKLAYVDSVVKPPRNVARQQVKNGIIDRKSVLPTAKLSALAKSGEAGKVSVPNPGSRAAERSSSSALIKPKKAPLMAKTLSFLKNRFKR